MIPTPDSIDIAKLGNGGALSSDTCNLARKARRILLQLIENKDGIVHEFDCVQKLLCVWFNGASNAVSVFITTYFEDSLEKISSFFRLSPNLAQVIRDYHKEFILTVNYLKGHGESFRVLMIKKYPDEYLMHAERA